MTKAIPKTFPGRRCSRAFASEEASHAPEKHASQEQENEISCVVQVAKCREHPAGNAGGDRKGQPEFYAGEERHRAECLVNLMPAVAVTRCDTLRKGAEAVKGSCRR